MNTHNEKNEFFEASFAEETDGHAHLEDESWMSHPTTSHMGRRWYDEIGHMTMAIQKTKQLPEQIQNIIANNLNENIDYHRQHLRTSGSSLSLGTKTVLGLYKSGLKQRWYDKNHSELSRAITMMSTLPEEFLNDYAKRIITLGDYLKQQEEIFDIPKDLNRTVETILNQSFTQLEETESGIRISEGRELDIHNPQKHIVATDHKKKR